MLSHPQDIGSSDGGRQRVTLLTAQGKGGTQRAASGSTQLPGGPSAHLGWGVGWEGLSGESAVQSLSYRVPRVAVRPQDRGRRKFETKAAAQLEALPTFTYLCFFQIIIISRG